jgi:hypothetical protein
VTATPRIDGETSYLIEAKIRTLDCPTMLLTLEAKRRLTVPATLAPIKLGDHFRAEFHAEDDTLIFHRFAPVGDWLEILKQCPVPMDDLPPRRRQLARHRKL